MTAETSIQALRKITKIKTERQQRVFDELLKHGDKGLTSNEIETLIKDRRANSRVVELRTAGWIETTSRKRNNPGTKGTGFIHIVPKRLRKKDAVPIPPKAKNTTSGKTVEMALVRGVEGYAIYLENYRIAGSKPWGGGEVIASWQVDSKDILKAMKK